MQDVKLWFKQHHAGQHHRQLLVIQGPEHWCIEQSQSLLSNTDLSQLWVNPPQHDDLIPHYTQDKNYTQYLGQEYHFLIYNAHTSCRANALMALSGIVTRGGIMILLLPSHPARDQNNNDVRDLWLRKQLTQHKNSHWLTPDGFNLGDHVQASNPAPHCIDHEQTRSVSQILKTATGKSKVPLVITSDRGRGKTSILGIAAAQMLKQGHDVIITAPSPITVQNAFKHCRGSLANESELAITDNAITLRGVSFKYIAPDALLSQLPKAKLVIVDEAAAIPSHLLNRICDNYNRLVFSTTIHGYEGSGKGFQLRFLPFLRQTFPRTRQLTLEQPMRWYKDDPLEQFWFNCFLSNPLSDTSTPGDVITSNKSLVVSKLTTDEMYANPEKLAQAFSLLVNAHYQTTPDDLWRLLSGEHQLLIGSQGTCLACAAIICDEGGNTTNKLSDDIIAGKRRLFGHLLPQNLGLHYQNREIVSSSFIRIVRIAVLPQYQQQGLGSEFLKQLPLLYPTHDFLGSSFAASSNILNFWNKNDYQTIRLGNRRDASSGEYSAMVIHPISYNATALTTLLAAQFQQDLLLSLARLHREVPTELIATLLQDILIEHSVSEHHQKLKQQFVAGGSLLVAHPALNFIVLNTRGWLYQPKPAVLLLIDYFLLNKDQQHIISQHKLTGKKQLEVRLRDCFNY